MNKIRFKVLKLKLQSDPDDVSNRISDAFEWPENGSAGLSSVQVVEYGKALEVIFTIQDVEVPK